MSDKPWTIRFKGYLPIDEGMEERLRRVQAEIANMPASALEIDEESRTITIDYAQVKDRLASVREAVHAVRAGEHIVVKPPWDEYDALEDDIVVAIDPGIVFGSGLHESTRLCLRALEMHLRPGCLAVDFGTGTGVLAIAAAKLGAREVIAFDGDPDCIETATANVRRNGVDGVVSVHLAESPAFIESRADLVTANLTADIIAEHAEAISKLLAPDGVVIVSGVTRANFDQAEDSLHRAGLSVTDRLAEGRWVALIAENV